MTSPTLNTADELHIRQRSQALLKKLMTKDNQKILHENTSPTTSTAPALMTWSVKRINLPRPVIIKLPLAFSCIPILMSSYVTFILWDSLSENYDFVLIAGGVSTATILFLLKVALQKSNFHYRIHADQGEVEYQLHTSKYAGDIFIGIVIMLIFMFILLAIFTGSLLFLLGTIIFIVIPATRLLKWEPPAAQHETSMPWIEHNFVTVDRKHLIIVAHYTDTTTGFKARFPNKELFEQYLAFLHIAVAPHAEFTEKVWEW